MTETAQTAGEPPGIAEIRTFLIADVRGYTRFTVEHGDAAAAKLASKFAVLAQDVVAARDGTVIELRGDEALAVFTSARQALWAATELQARVARETRATPSLAMKVGIGIDAGEAIPVQGGYRGAALNLAARLCSLAGPGEVLASETVVNLARKVDGLDYAERGFAQLKGFTDPVKVMAVVPVHPHPLAPSPAEQEMGDTEDSLAGSPLPFTGEGSGVRVNLPIGGFLGALPSGVLVARDQELSRVLTAVDAVAGGEGRFVLLAGEPGAGKTRLAQEVTLQARNREFLVATGICYDARQSVPYYPFLDALATLYGAAPATIRAQVPQRWPYLGRLLPEAGITVPPSGTDAHDEQERLFRAIAGFIQALAEIAPVALLLDDLHWADESSLDLLRHLATHTRAYRVLLLGAYRDVEVGRQHPLERALLDLTREQLVERVAVRRLDQEGTAALIGAALGEEEISEEFSGLVHGHTEGNPFFTQEVLRALVEGGDVFRRGDVWDRRAVEEIQVPESVRAVIGQRLSRLSDNAQELLREASVLGQTFVFDDLQAMSGRGEDDVEEWLEEGRAAGLVREADRDGYAFNHALTQQALYAELSSRRRRRLHLAAGEAIERLPERKQKDKVAELAWHFLEADDSERALRYALLAGDQAEAVFARSEAERHFRTACELATELDDRPRLAEASLKLGLSRWNTHDHDEALPLLERASRLYAQLDDPVLEARATLPTIFVYDTRGLPDKATDALERVERLLECIAQSEPSRDQALCYLFLVQVYFARGDPRDAGVMAERGVEVARALGDEALQSRAELSRAQYLGMVGRPREAIEVAEAIIPRAEATGDLETLGEAVSNAAEFSMLVGEFERSRAYRERELAVWEHLGFEFLRVFVLSNLAQLDRYRGDWQASRRYAEDAIARGEEMDNGFVVRAARGGLGELLLFEGDWDKARRELDESAAASAGTLQIHRYIQRELAQLNVVTGHPDEAVARLTPLLEGAEPGDNDITFLLPILAWAHLANGDLEQAAPLAEQAVERATAQEFVLALVDALWVQGMVLTMQDRRREAVEIFEENVRLAQRMPYPYAEARALYEWAMLELGQQETERARDRLQQALAIFGRLGAQKDSDRTAQALASLT